MTENSPSFERISTHKYRVGQRKELKKKGGLGQREDREEKRIPLLGKGGVDAPIKKMSRSHLSGRRRGGLFHHRLLYVKRTTPAAPNLKVASHLFVRRGSPLLYQGGEYTPDRRFLCPAGDL